VIEFRILGPLEVVDHEPLSLGGHKQQAVLAVLLLHRGEVIAADRLIEAVWAGRAPATAAKTLQVYISNLRKSLGEGPLVTQGRGYLLATEPDQVDSDRFEKLAAKGREALEHEDPQRARTWLESALTLWRGPALTDFSYESFAQSEIARLEEARMATLESRIEADLRLGRHTALVPELEALVHEHPLRERLYEQLMIALYRSGRQVDALERYQRARRKLIDDFGIEPGPRLQEIQRAVLTHDSMLDLPGRRRFRHRPIGSERPRATPARSLAPGIPALLASVLSALSGLRRQVGAFWARVGRRVRLPSQPRARLEHLQLAVRRQLAGGMWAVLAVGALLILAVVLVLTVGGRSGARAHKPRVRADWAGISSPSAGGVYSRGQLVATTFTCGRSAGGPPLRSCTDSTGTATATGGHGHLDTSTTGFHRYTVVVTVKGGETRSTSISYTVGPPPSVSIGTAVATASHSRTTITLACSGGSAGATCSGVLSLTGEQRVVRRVGQRRTATFQTVTVARAGYSLTSGARRSIVVPLTNAGTLALRAAPGHRMQLRATITVTNGPTAQRTIALKRRARR
jgi:DNA-binding SARP family transcriptional activator